MAKMTKGAILEGPAGTATEVLQSEPPKWPATVATWFLHCPGQSVAWSHYLLSVVHLRPLHGVPDPVISVPHATHEVILLALDPAGDPKPTRTKTWKRLFPINVCEQIQVPDDDAARQLLYQAALGVMQGILPAEPPLSGAVEPWRTVLLKTAAHLRGEEHAP